MFFMLCNPNLRKDFCGLAFHHLSGSHLSLQDRQGDLAPQEAQGIVHPADLHGGGGFLSSNKSSAAWSTPRTRYLQAELFWRPTKPCYETKSMP